MRVRTKAKSWEARYTHAAHHPAVDADTERMDSLVSLKYPNGRTHEDILTSPDELRPGAEFDLHGRRWRALGFASHRGRRSGRESARMLCVTADDVVESARK